MNKKVLVVVLIAIGVIAFAQDTYEGLATVGAFGRFPAGLYGATNVVGPNSLVTVRNLDTGVSERVIITGGVTEPGVFLVLSPEAAALLGIGASGATLVRVVPISTFEPSGADEAAETAFSPDPDINPAASTGSLIDTLPPAVSAADITTETTEPTGADRTISPQDVIRLEETTETTEATSAESLLELAEAEVPDAGAGILEPPLADGTIPGELAEEPDVRIAETAETAVTPMPEGVRSGIGAGIRRTSVGQTQESFERPEPTLDSRRPVPIDPDAVPQEPVVEAEETASGSMASLTPLPDADPRARFMEPDVPAEETQEIVAAEATEEEVVEVTEVAVVEAGPIDTAIAEIAERLPRKDTFPAPVGEERDVGFANLVRPTDPAIAVATLPVASTPGIEVPSLAGIGPLTARIADLDVTLAEAVPPDVEIPEYAALAARTPAGETPIAQLPEASPEAVERPVAEDLGPMDAVVDTSPLPTDDLAEARVVEERPEEPEEPEEVVVAAAIQEPPDLYGLSTPSSPVEEILTGGLAEAVPEEIERPDGYALGPRTALVPDPEAVLAEAQPEAEEIPDVAALTASTPDEQAVSLTLAEAIPEEMERPDGYALGPRTALVPDPEAVLAEARPEAEEVPDVASRLASAPAESELKATLAEAIPQDEEAASVADVGPVPAPTDLPFDAVLVEAIPAAEETPDESLALSEPGDEPISDAALVEAVPEDEEIPDESLASTAPDDQPGLDAALVEAAPEQEETPEESMASVEPSEEPEPAAALVEAVPAEEPAEQPAELPVLADDATEPAVVPEDALLTLEPADFRPPVAPEPDEESIIDREEPTGETPAAIAVADEPEVVEEAPVAVVAARETPDLAVSLAPGELPVVEELVDNSYYLQVGAYRNPATAQVTVDALGATYPMAVLPLESSGGPVYRVLVGPLQQDETGMLLLWLRSSGYRDTFIRSGNEL
jgi:hypothetical protein